MSGHMSNQNIFISKPPVANFAYKRRFLVALEPQVASQIVQVLVGGNAFVASVPAVFGHSVTVKISFKEKMV